MAIYLWNVCHLNDEGISYNALPKVIMLPYTLMRLKWVHCLFLFPLAYGKCNCHYLSSFLKTNIVFVFVLFCFVFVFQNFKMTPIWKKKVIFYMPFISLYSRGKRHKNLFSTHLTSTHTRILLTVLTIFTLLIWPKFWIYHLWFLFWVTPGVDSLSINNKILSKSYIFTRMPTL